MLLYASLTCASVRCPSLTNVCQSRKPSGTSARYAIAAATTRPMMFAPRAAAAGARRATAERLEAPPPPLGSPGLLLLAGFGGFRRRSRDRVDDVVGALADLE